MSLSNIFSNRLHDLNDISDNIIVVCYNEIENVTSFWLPAIRRNRVADRFEIKKEAVKKNKVNSYSEIKKESIGRNGVIDCSRIKPKMEENANNNSLDISLPIKE